MPVPESVTLSAEFVAELAIVTLPFAPPALDGLNVTFRVTLWPVVRVTGAVPPLIPNPIPDTVMLEISTELLCVPVFVSTSDIVFVLPVGTFPKFNAELLGASVPAAGEDEVLEGVLATLVLEHPALNNVIAIRTRTKAHARGRQPIQPGTLWLKLCD